MDNATSNTPVQDKLLERFQPATRHRVGINVTDWAAFWRLVEGTIRGWKNGAVPKEPERYLIDMGISVYRARFAPDQEWCSYLYSLPPNALPPSDRLPNAVLWLRHVLAAIDAAPATSTVLVASREPQYLITSTRWRSWVKFNEQRGLDLRYLMPGDAQFRDTVGALCAALNMLPGSVMAITTPQVFNDPLWDRCGTCLLITKAAVDIFSPDLDVYDFSAAYQRVFEHADAILPVRRFP